MELGEHTDKGLEGFLKVSLPSFSSSQPSDHRLLPRSHSFDRGHDPSGCKVKCMPFKDNGKGVAISIFEKNQSEKLQSNKINSKECTFPILLLHNIC